MCYSGTKCSVRAGILSLILLHSTQSLEYGPFCCEQGSTIVTAISASSFTGRWPKCSISLPVYDRIARCITSFQAYSLSFLNSIRVIERTSGAAQYRLASQPRHPIPPKPPSAYCNLFFSFRSFSSRACQYDLLSQPGKC